MRTLKLTVAYDGTRFVGWQRQAAGESIQGLIESALAPIEGAPVDVQGAGRTDAGVHALAQVASVRLECSHDLDTLQRAVNAHLPADVRVLAIEEADAAFHARFSARAKTYRYLIRTTPLISPFDRLYAWHVPRPLDVEAMQTAAARVIGTHDFAAFQSAGSDVASTVRTITESTITPGDVLAYEVSGNGFLRHMVRAIAGTLVEVGTGRRAAASMAALLAGAARAQAGRTAPPHGLFLVRVFYD